ncbi:phenazine biosynthesis-like domain-containing protein 1 [Nannospalax galili]|uniref:phenazine biosynthesis-like domain-containing protein 1 n=1 Tax=Nannospalax galili TaxID=1026970 RepID=UPI00111C30FC|nr:phenazine biosynthesis-like domain-containing protein 1 [Nannospalax galili]
MKLPMFIVDAFTARPFRGNPAAVCLLDRVTLRSQSFLMCPDTLGLWFPCTVSDGCGTYQGASAELSTLPVATQANSSRFGLRWFTPVSEVPLCGHATLASAAVLFHKIGNTNSTLTFVTLSGELKARRADDGIVLDFPLYPTFPQDVHEVEDLIKAAIGDTLVQDVQYSPDTQKLLVRLSDSYNRSFLETLRVNTETLPQIENTVKVKGLILTLKGEPGGQTPAYDFYSRYFAPWVGLAEDPVTGSAHTVLSSYWSEQLGKKEMRDFWPRPLSPHTSLPAPRGSNGWDLPGAVQEVAEDAREGKRYTAVVCGCPAFQCSRRGGRLDVSLRPDGRVDLKGGVAVVLEGTLMA